MTKSKVTISAEFKTEKPSEAIRAIQDAIDAAKVDVESHFEGTIKECKNEKIGFHKQ